MTDQVRNFINSALTAGTTQEKIQQLTAAKEWIIHRRQEITSQDDLLDLIQELCSPALQLDAAQPVRHFVLQFVEELSRTAGTTPTMLLKPMEALALMLEDANQPDQIARWALTTAAKSWKCVLALVANNVKNVEASRLLQSILWRIRSVGVDLIEHRKDRGSKLNAIKFVEIMCMSLFNDAQTKKKPPVGSVANSSSGATAQQFESLRDAPRFTHPALPKVQELQDEGMSLLSVLIRCLQSEDQHLPVRLACSNSLTLIARMRPDARDPVVEAMVKLTNSLISSASVASKKDDVAFMQALKTNSIMLLKSVAPDEKSLDSPLIPKLTQVLRQLKADEHLQRHLDPLRNKKMKLEMEAEEIKRRLKDYPPQQNKFPTEGLHLLPIDTLARLIIDNAGNVPEKPPPGHPFKALPRDSNVLLGPTGLPPKLERVMALIRAVETGRGLILPKPLQDLKTRDVSAYEALKQREQAFIRVMEASLTSQSTGRGFGWAGEKSYETSGMVAARLACDVALDDDEEHVSEDTPDRNSMRDQLIDQLLAKSASEADDEVAAIAALHVEFCAARLMNGGDAKSSTSSRYDSFIAKVVSKLIQDGSTKNYKRLSKITSEAPALPLTSVKMITVLCESPADYKAAFLILRDLILSRPSIRASLVKVLLYYATKPDASTSSMKDRRLDAVRLIANKLYKGLGVKWGEQIRELSYDVLLSLQVSLKETAPKLVECKQGINEFLGTPVEQPDVLPILRVALGGMTVDEEKSEVVSRIHLFVALCASDSRLLPQLFLAYAALRQNIASVDMKEFISQPTDELKFKQRRARILDLFHFETDQLWNKLAGDLNSSAKAVALLQDFCAGSQDLILRACHVFAKRDTESAVSQVLQLKASGAEEPITKTDVRFLVPIIGSLSREESIDALVRIALHAPAMYGGDMVKSKEEIKRAIENIANGTVGRSIDPSELLIALANMPTDDVQILINATDAFLDRTFLAAAVAPANAAGVVNANQVAGGGDQKALVNERVMRKVFHELVDQEQYPVVLLRIVITAHRNLPALKMDALHVCQRLIEREVWHNDQLWKGFIILAGKLLPESFEIILRLPDDVFKSFITETEKLNKNFRDLLKNAARMNRSVVQSIKSGEGDGSDGQEQSSQSENSIDIEMSDGASVKKKQGKIEISAFAKEYLGL